MSARFREVARRAFAGTLEQPSFRGVLVLMVLVRFLLSFAANLGATLYRTFLLENLHLAYADTVILSTFHRIVGFLVVLLSSSALDHLPVMPVITGACLLSAVFHLLLAQVVTMPLFLQVFILCAAMPVNGAFILVPLQLSLKRVLVVEYAGDDEMVKRRIDQFISLFYVMHNLGDAAADWVVGHWRSVVPAIQANINVVLLSAGLFFLTVLFLLLIRRLAPQADRPTPNGRKKTLEMTFGRTSFWRCFFVMLAMSGVMSMFFQFDLTLTKELLIELGTRSPFPYLQLINPVVIVLLASFIVPWILQRLRVHTYDAFVTGTSLSAFGILFMGLALQWGGLVEVLGIGIFIFSVGEAIWSPRLSAYALIYAPEGFEAVYQALSQLPYMASIFLAPVLSYTFIRTFCGSVHCNGMGIWTSLGLVAASSPLILTLGRRWMEEEEKAETFERV